jgi:DNA-binding transcriptional LysR family regulator
LLGVAADHRAARTHLDKPMPAATLRELVQQETWLSTTPGQVSRLAGDSRLAAAGAVPLRRWEFEGLYVLARLVAVGAGVALLPSSIAAYERNVVAIPLQPRMYRHVRLLTRATTRDDPAVAACVKAIQQGLRRPWTI